jgi:hypothetical protein
VIEVRRGRKEYLLVKSNVPISSQDMQMCMPRAGGDYIHIGLSGSHNSYRARKGNILSSVDLNTKYVTGSAGSAKGDYGAGVFQSQDDGLFGMCVGKANVCDFDLASMRPDMKTHANAFASASGTPHYAYICPSYNFLHDDVEVDDGRELNGSDYWLQ